MKTEINWKAELFDNISSQDLEMLMFILASVKREKRTSLHKYIAGDGRLPNHIDRLEELWEIFNRAWRRKRR
tara:strand:- start:581 stop:796 length:216 start_codon:yes stop_codon:yes gene_type:complete